MTTATAPDQESGLQTTSSSLPVKPADAVRAALERLKPQMEMALPRHLTPDRLCRVAMTAVQQTPALLNCDRTSLYAAVMTCAQLGLEPDGVLGQAYLVPFKGKVQFIPGYKGLISLARNSGEVRSISAHEVYANDHFEYAFGLNEKLEHVPTRGERGDIVAFYAVAHFINGGHHFEVMTREEVEAIRDKSQAWMAFQSKKIRETPWDSNFVEMGKKTAIRRMSKFLPMNVQKAAALADMYDSGRHAELGDAGELLVDPAEGDGGNVIDVSAEEGKSSLDRFADGAGDSSQDADDAPPPPDDDPPPASKGDPELFTPERKAALISQAEVAYGVGTTEAMKRLDTICADLCGSGLDGTPASFDPSIVKRLQKAAERSKK